MKPSRELMRDTEGELWTKGDCGWLNGVCMHGNWRTRGELPNARVLKLGRTENCSTYNSRPVGLMLQGFR